MLCPGQKVMVVVAGSESQWVHHFRLFQIVEVLSVSDNGKAIACRGKTTHGYIAQHLHVSEVNPIEEVHDDTM